MRRTLFAAVAGFLTVGLAPTPVVAHSGHTSHGGGTPILPVAIFASGLMMLGAGLYLDARDDVEDIYADAGVFLGVGGLLAAIALFLF